MRSQTGRRRARSSTTTSRRPTTRQPGRHRHARRPRSDVRRCRSTSRSSSRRTSVGFDAGDVTFGGGAGPTTPRCRPVDANTYTVTVTGMTTSGTVTCRCRRRGTRRGGQSEHGIQHGKRAVEPAGPQPRPPLALTLPANIVRNNDPGQAGAVVTFNASATGGVQPVVVVCTPASGSFFPLGTTTVTCTATDADEGLDEAIVSGSFTVQVIDNQPPTIADLPDLTRTTTNTTPVVVTFPLPAASDNSGVAPTVTCAPVSGSAFAVGVATVTCTATDGAGLTASSSFTVTVSSSPSAPPTPDADSEAAADRFVVDGHGSSGDPARRRRIRTSARRRPAASVQERQRLIDHVEAGVRIVEGDVARRHDVDPVGGDERPHAVLLAERGESTHGRGVDRGA